MKDIRIEDKICHVDIEKTREYYLSNSLCICDDCKNLFLQISNLSYELNTFFNEFGIDIKRPDESGGIEIDDYIYYQFIAYSVVGNVDFKNDFSINVDGFNIVITGNKSNHWFPNEQYVDNYFFVFIENVKLPNYLLK